MSHGSYRRGCRCLSCRRAESLRVRAACERVCVDCGGACWGLRCFDCWRLDRLERAVRPRRATQPRGLHYQWGCP